MRYFPRSGKALRFAPLTVSLRVSRGLRTFSNSHSSRKHSVECASQTNVVTTGFPSTYECKLTRLWTTRFRAFCSVASETVPRAVACFFAAFSLLNILGELRHAGFDANIWWIDLSPLSIGAARTFLMISATVLLAFAVHPPVRPVSRAVACSVAGMLVVIALRNSLEFYRLVNAGRINSSFEFPVSFLVAMGFLSVAIRSWKPTNHSANGPRRNQSIAFAMVVNLMGFGIGFPVCQMVCFGQTDYRQEADVAVVLGCRAYPNGEPSAALYDRVRTGCLLYVDGTVGKLLFSGGPGDGDIHETESMRRLAISMGVPDEDILVDAHGLSTQSTADNSTQIFEEHGFTRVLAVSHFYHMPRIKLCFRRAGVNVRTVPCEETYVVSQLGYCMAREVAALWLYYLRPIAGRKQWTSSARQSQTDFAITF